MLTKLQQLDKKLHCYKRKQLLLYGLKKGLIIPYDDKLIEKLRKIYYGPIPASIILLSNAMTNGYCYDRALLMSRAFLDEEEDVKLLYVTIDSLKYKNKSSANHCVCERITKEGKHLIYDTSLGLIFDKKMYWLLENPKVRKINSKEMIKQFVEIERYSQQKDISKDKYDTQSILSMIEMTLGQPTEMYSLEGIELLQREIEYFKQSIDNVDIEKDSNIKILELKNKIK